MPAGQVTRPTSDRVRESLFAAVTSELGSLDGAAVLDLYAGSGAVGLEAASRGAADVLLIESDARAARVIRANADALGLPGVTLICDRAERVLRRGPNPAWPRRRFAFADPPYSLTGRTVSDMLESLAGNGWLSAGALVVIERDARSDPLVWPPGYVRHRSRRYGETVLWYGHAAGDQPAAAAATTGG